MVRKPPEEKNPVLWAEDWKSGSFWLYKKCGFLGFPLKEHELF